MRGIQLHGRRLHPKGNTERIVAVKVDRVADYRVVQRPALCAIIKGKPSTKRTGICVVWTIAAASKHLLLTAIIVIFVCAIPFFKMERQHGTRPIWLVCDNPTNYMRIGNELSGPQAMRHFHGWSLGINGKGSQRCFTTIFNLIFCSGSDKVTTRRGDSCDFIGNCPGAITGNLSLLIGRANHIKCVVENGDVKRIGIHTTTREAGI